MHSLPIAIEFPTQGVERFKIPPAARQNAGCAACGWGLRRRQVSAVAIQHIDPGDPMADQLLETIPQPPSATGRLSATLCRQSPCRTAPGIGKGRRSHCASRIRCAKSDFLGADRVATNQCHRTVLFNRSGWQDHRWLSGEIGFGLAPGHLLQPLQVFFCKQVERFWDSFGIGC